MLENLPEEILNQLKRCRSCKTPLLEHFNIRPSALKKKDYLCRDCRNAKQKHNYANNGEVEREKNRKRQNTWRKKNPTKALAADLKRFNLSVEEYTQILNFQKEVCAICEEGPRKWSRLSVDHKEDKIRGLLCDRCNRALGMLGDDLSSFKRILDLMKATVD